MQTIIRHCQMRAVSVVFLLALLCLGKAQADWKASLPEVEVIGQGSFSWFGLPIYSARLWASEPDQLFEQPFALELTYAREISRERLVSTSVDEIRRVQGRRVADDHLQRWAAEMRQAFVDVSPGKQIIGVHLPGAGSRFYVDGQLQHVVTDEAFSRAFFSIWLDPKTRSPALRQALLGLD